MADFATFDDLDRFSLVLNESELRKSAATKSPDKNLFISHSSADNRWLPGLISLLQNHEARVYVDQEDVRLPRVPSPETAAVLREALRSCPRFVLFVSTNTKASTWIPWELGLGDGHLGPTNVALFPAARSSTEQSWADQEYLGLYRRIVWGRLGDAPQPQWFVHDHRKNTGTALRQWIMFG